MKKLLLSLCALSMGATLSIHALEKSGEPYVDAETLRIEESMGEHPKERLYFQQQLAKLDKQTLKAHIEKLKEEAKRKTGAALERIKARIKQYENAIKTKLQ